MQTATQQEKPHLIDRMGIPRPLLWGFVGLLLFMIGDGVEAGYLAPYLEGQGHSSTRVALLFTVYGVAVSISSWLSGPLSDLWGPKKSCGPACGSGVFLKFCFCFLASSRTTIR